MSNFSYNISSANFLETFCGSNLTYPAICLRSVKGVVQIQAIGYFLKDRQIFVNQWLPFLS